jgi:hypothetical protein
VTARCTVVLTLHVQPGARQTLVAGRYGNGVKLRVAAPPESGRANAAVLRLLAETFGVPRRNVTLEAGHTSRQKRVRVQDVDPAALARWEEKLDQLARLTGSPPS